MGDAVLGSRPRERKVFHLRIRPAIGGCGRQRKNPNEFPQAVPIDSKFPDLVLATTHGEVFRTADLKGTKHFVLVTGAIS